MTTGKLARARKPCCTATQTTAPPPGARPGAVSALNPDQREHIHGKPVRQVLIPKKQRGKFRPLGIPCLRDRVAQTSAMLVLEPILEADLQPEQYAYRPGRSAHDAVNRVHSLLNRG